MFVIKWLNLGDNAVANTGSGQSRIFPADRCTWEYDTGSGTENAFGYDSATRQYGIESVVFYDGSNTGTALPVGPPAGSPRQGGEATLGYIGKSGRFVPITEPSQG